MRNSFAILGIAALLAAAAAAAYEFSSRKCRHGHTSRPKSKH